MNVGGMARAAVLVVGGGVLAAAATLVEIDPAAQTVVASSRNSTPVTASSLTCPGASTNANFGVASAPTLLEKSLANGPGLERVAGGSAPQSLALQRGATNSFDEKRAPVTIRATGEMAPGLAAVQYGSTGSALSARACSGSANEAWIPVGQKQSGRLLTLVLVNSGSHAASVDVDVRAADGDVVGAQVSDQAVGAHARVQLNLPAEAVTHPGTLVHVRSEGGSIQASVRDSSSSGDERGDELVAQYAPGSVVQNVPGVPVVSGRARVRLATVTGAAAVVRVQAWSEEDASSRDEVVTIPAGRTVDVTIDGLHGKLASLRATAQTAIVAAGYGASAESGSKDFVWVPAAPDIETMAGVTLRGSGAAGTAVMTSDGHARTVVAVIVDEKGATTRRSLVVPAKGDARLELSANSSLWLQAPAHDGVSGVHANVLVRAAGNGAITSVPFVASPWHRIPITLNQN